jgi:hypothetical protein
MNGSERFPRAPGNGSSERFPVPPLRGTGTWNCSGTGVVATTSRSSVAVVQIGDAYLPLKKLSAYAGLSVRRLRDYLTDPARPLPFYRFGGKILVRRSDFDAWAAQFRCADDESDARASAVEAHVEEFVRDLR